MAEKSTLSTQTKVGEFSPLESIVHMATRRYGDFSDEGIMGDLMLMLVEIANRVVEDVRSHPYWDGTALDYYTHQAEVRPIPDMIVLDGLVYHYALQQGSQKAEYLSKLYAKSLNGILYNRKYGNAPIETKPIETTQVPGQAVSS